jgi:hypothetical protein
MVSSGQRYYNVGSCQVSQSVSLSVTPSSSLKKRYSTVGGMHSDYGSMMPIFKNDIAFVRPSLTIQRSNLVVPESTLS